MHGSPGLPPCIFMQVLLRGNERFLLILLIKNAFC